MAFPRRPSNAQRKSGPPQEISSERAVQYFLAELDAAAEGENRETCLCAVLLRALFHPRLYFFAELLRHPAVVAIAARSEQHERGVAIGQVLFLTRLFSLGTTYEYRRKREESRRELAARSIKQDSGHSSSSSSGPPPLLPILLRKLRLLTTLTLASYTEELSLSGLAAALSVSEEDVAGSAQEFVDSLLLGLDSSSVLEMQEHATSDSRCSFRRTLLDTVLLSSAQATSAITEFGHEGIAKAVLGAEDAEDIVLASMQLGWLRGKVGAESGVLFVKSVAGRDVDTEDDLEVMKLVLQDFGNRIEAAVALIQQKISTARREAEDARSKSEIPSTVVGLTKHQ